MALTIATFTLLVDDYDRGIAYFRDVLGLTLAEDTALGGGTRWVVMTGAGGARMLLAQADGGSCAAARGGRDVPRTAAARELWQRGRVRRCVRQQVGPDRA